MTVTGHGPVQLVTVSREFGSGGSDLAEAIGRRLGWRVVDREVVARVAEELRVPEQEVEAHDEHVDGVAERVARYLSGSFPEVVFPVEERQRLKDWQVAHLAEAVVREAAAAPRVVVVGHGGMCLFSDRADALHVRVVAPTEHRVAEVVRRLATSEAEARREIRLRDAEREAFIRRRYGRVWDACDLFSVVVNSAAVGPEEGAAMVAALVDARSAGRDPAGPEVSPRG